MFIGLESLTRSQIMWLAERLILILGSINIWDMTTFVLKCGRVEIWMFVDLGQEIFIN